LNPDKGRDFIFSAASPTRSGVNQKQSAWY